MATPIKDSLTDHSVKDGTGDPILGSEVDTNPNLLADILDGTVTTDLGGAAAVDFLGLRVIDLDNATGAVQTNLTLEWDPADGNNLTDNTSGIGIDFKMPDDADNQDVFASLNVMCVSDATTTENGEFSFKVMTDGTNSEVMTLQSTLGAAGTVLTLATAEPTVVDGDVLGRIDFQAPSEGSGTDAILVGASIYAEADDTFASGLNDTDLVFAVAESETAAERMRLSYDGTTTDLNFAGVANISSGGDITLSATGDVNLPADIGLTFGDDGEKIEGDGTNLTIASSAQVIVTPTTDTIFSNGTGVVVGHTGQATVGGHAPEMQVLGTGAADTRLLMGRFSADSSPAIIQFVKSRDPAIFDGSFAIVNDNDEVGAITAYVDDGADLTRGIASIDFVVDDASPAENAVGGSMLFYTSATDGTVTERLHIDATGNLLVNDAAVLSSRVGTIQVKGQGSAPGQLSLVHGSDDGDFISLLAESSTNKHIFMWDNGTDMRFATAANVAGGSYSEMMRIETSGDVGIGTTPDATTRFHVVSPHANQTAYLENSSSGNSYGLYLHLSGATNDNETTTFIDAADATTRRAVCFSNGDWENHDNSYGGISDVKLKTDIRDVRSYWDNFKALEYKKFKFKSDVEYSKNRPAEIAAEIVELKEELDDTDSETKLTTEEIVRLNAEIARLESEVVADATDRLGLIAQDVEDIFPALVRHTPDRAEDTDIDSATFGEFIDLDTETLGLKNSIIDGVINSIVLQEAMARIETLETKVTALENA
jgi:hypothetical protein